MGNCLRKRPLQIQTQECPTCHERFQQGQPFSSHVAQCRPIQHQPRMQIIQQIAPQQVEIQIAEPPQVRVSPGQYLIDEFKNNKPKEYWCKELQQDSKTKYRWVLKISQPLPCKNVQEMLALPQNQVQNLDFASKQIWFRLKLETLRISWQQGADSLHVNHGSFLMTTLGTYKEINWHKEVKVHIDGDKGMDAGGLLREWSSVIMKEIIHPESGLFLKADTDDVSYKINSEADVDEHVLDCFKLLGTVIGKCIFERIPINAYLDRSIIKHMIGQPVLLEDMYFYDRPLYQSWDYLLNNKFSGTDLQEYFAIYRKSRGDFYELKPKGEQIMVDMDNIQEYVNLCIDYYTYTSIKPFLMAFLNQLFKIIPKNYLSIFTPLQLEMVLYGVPFIDLKDWRENTQFKGAYYRNHVTIMWFWEVLESFDQLKLAKFLQFCTGSQRTPVEGFRKLETNRGNYSKFCIESVPYKNESPFPKAHTCTNRLELPMYFFCIIKKIQIKSYETKEDVELYLNAIVNADMEGQFGLE